MAGVEDFCSTDSGIENMNTILDLDEQLATLASTIFRNIGSFTAQQLCDNSLTIV